MKKLFVLIALVSTLATSCMTFGTNEDPPTTDVYDLNKWVYYNIEYEAVAKPVSAAQTPQVTLARRKGNCVDQSVLLIYLAESEGLGTGYLVGMTDGVRMHVVAKINNSMYDPTNGEFYGGVFPAGFHEIPTHH